MATLESLKTSILNMSDNEAFDLIKHVRHVRRTYVPPKKKRAGSSRSTPKAKATALSVDQMDGSQLEALISLLEGVMK